MCQNPDVLEAVRIIKIIIDIIKIVVPIILLLSLSIHYFNAVKTGDENLLKKANKAAVSNCIAAILIFLIPGFVNVVVRLSTNDSINTEDCYSNATTEYIATVYETKASEAVARAEKSQSYSDYSNAVILVNDVKDSTTKANLNQRLEVVKKAIDEKAQEEANKPGNPGGTGTVPTPGGQSSTGGASCYRGCRTSEPDPSAVINCWTSIVNPNNFIYPTDSSGRKLGSWPKNYSSIPAQLTNYKTYQGEFVVPITPTGSIYNHVYQHNGIDFMAPFGSPVYSPVDGTIIYSTWGHTGNKAGTESAYTVSIKMNKTVNYDGKQLGQIFMTHLSGIIYRCESSCGISVKKGQLIGFSGNAAGAACSSAGWTSAGWAPHLHMTIHPSGNYNAGIQTTKIETLYGLKSGMKLQAGG